MDQDSSPPSRSADGESAADAAADSAPETAAAKAKVHHFPCPGCSADLTFEPVDGTLTCPYCGRKEIIPQSADQVVERSFEEYLHAPSGAGTQIADGALEVRCDGCGATTAFLPPQVAGDCSFCGRELVAQPKAADPMIAPEGVLPFVIPSDQATKKITEWIQSRWFAPSALRKFARHDSIGGIYLPFWTYDVHTTSCYSGERGEHYYVTENYTSMVNGRQVNQSRQVRRTRWYPASGQVARWFDDVLVPATHSVSPASLEELAPWDLPAIVPYEPAYLAGFKANRYESDFRSGFERARELMAGQIESDVCADIGGDEQRISELKTAYSGITFKHVLLPVYLAAYRFNEKVYQVMVNARTGEVIGERPYSLWKIAVFILACFAIGFGILLASKGTPQSPANPTVYIERG